MKQKVIKQRRRKDTNAERKDKNRRREEARRRQFNQLKKSILEASKLTKETPEKVAVAETVE